LKCQIGIASSDSHGGRRTLPWVFTEQGISMLSSVIHTDISLKANIGISVILEAVLERLQA
ncbi:MAG: hypothetical protein IKR80_07445, partial [Spirochaetales bacterium]|nr:hypothetical protein [Spirochaetales bacterium]